MEDGFPSGDAGEPLISIFIKELKYMDSHLVDFEKLDWNSTAKGIRFKAFVSGNQRLRLVEFSEGFIEQDWCLNGHAGYVLEGGFSIDFNGRTEHFKKGGTLFIPGEKKISIK